MPEVDLLSGGLVEILSGCSILEMKTKQIRPLKTRPPFCYRCSATAAASSSSEPPAAAEQQLPPPQQPQSRRRRQSPPDRHGRRQRRRWALLRAPPVRRADGGGRQEPDHGGGRPRRPRLRHQEPRAEQHGELAIIGGIAQVI